MLVKLSVGIGDSWMEVKFRREHASRGGSHQHRMRVSREHDL